MTQHQAKMFATPKLDEQNVLHQEQLARYLRHAKKFDIFFLVVVVSIVVFYKMTHKYKTDVSQIADEVDSSDDERDEKSTKHALVKGEFHEYPLVSKKPLTNETAIYRFALPGADYVLGLPIGQHISIRANIDGRKVLRSYTPISLDYEARGYFEMLIKAYPQGNISRLVGELKLGDTIDMCGPAGFYDYVPGCRRKLGMVAGGTGITPMYQIVKAIADNAQDTTEVSLIYGSACEEELFLKRELDEMAARRPGQIKVYYTVDKAPSDGSWKGGVGYVTPELLQERMPDPKEDGVQLLLCGPPRMVSSLKRAAVAMGYTKGKPVSRMEDQIFTF